MRPTGPAGTYHILRQAQRGERIIQHEPTGDRGGAAVAEFVAIEHERHELPALLQDRPLLADVVLSGSLRLVAPRRQ